MQVKVKWGKEKLDVDLDPSEGPDVFKAQLFAVTQVSPDRQKLMVKGKTVSDTWEGFKLKDGMIFLMMGTAGALLEAPTKAVVFDEDLSDEQKILSSVLPAGIANQGNTCYLNSAIQCFRQVEPLRNQLEKFAEEMKGSLGGSSSQTTTALSIVERDRELAAMVQQDVEIQKSLMYIIAGGEKPDLDDKPNLAQFRKKLKLRMDAVFIMENCMQLMTTEPHKSLTLALSGVISQLSASESIDAINTAMGTLLTVLRQTNPQFAQKDDHGRPAQQDAAEVWNEMFTNLNRSLSKDPSNSAIRQNFGTRVKFTLKCDDNPDEPEEVMTEEELQLRCNITKTTGHMMSGLESAFEEKIQKNSSSLNRDAIYTKKGTLERAPGYLVVNFVRFFYKQKEKTACKILKDVKFPVELDIQPLCSKELTSKMKPARDAFEEYRNAEIEKEVTMAVDSDKSEDMKEFEPYSFSDDPGSNNSGMYTLEAVLTHKGRDNSSGHYIAFCRGKKAGEWLCFDDDTVTPVTEENVRGLSGKSADGHMAYILVYGPKRLPKRKEEESKMDTS
eukprot:m.34659 g.34659  ORF g.34659 m.34659 type:complete len:557 (-) comp8759_c0_seq2:2549-4219(-)